MARPPAVRHGRAAFRATMTGHPWPSKYRRRSTWLPARVSLRMKVFDENKKTGPSTGRFHHSLPTTQVTTYR
jgi:hypothetical protein